jgi:hypothetical protein
MTPVAMAPVESAGLENELPGLPSGGSTTPPPPETPEQRLAASREKIRAALTRRHSADGDGTDAKGRPRRRGVWRGMRRVLSRVPLSKMAVGGVQRWWQHHPWRSTIEFGLDAADEVVRPLAQRHPVLLVGGALVGGALLARFRPWRALSGSALLAGLLPAFRWSSLFSWITSSLSPATEDEQGVDSAAATAPSSESSTAAHARPATTPPSTDTMPSNGSIGEAQSLGVRGGSAGSAGDQPSSAPTATTPPREEPVPH